MHKLKKILSYPLSVLYFICFALTLLVFHPLQWVCFNLFGYSVHKKCVDVLNWCLLQCLKIVGVRSHVKINADVPKGHPVIIVSNHQSMWDIPPIMYYLRKYHPKFVSKKELGRGVPSVSYNLRHGGSVLIDRKDKEQALDAILKFAKYLQKTSRSGVIFPEGTRHKRGMIKPFKRSGLRTLIQNLKNGYVIPVTIKGTWKLQRWGIFPIPLGIKYEIVAHSAVKIADFDVEKLIDYVEGVMHSYLKAQPSV